MKNGIPSITGGYYFKEIHHRGHEEHEDLRK
jgi:hypothetical protein